MSYYNAYIHFTVTLLAPVCKIVFGIAQVLGVSFWYTLGPLITLENQINPLVYLNVVGYLFCICILAVADGYCFHVFRSMTET